MKLILEIELDYDENTMHGNDPDGIEWFWNDVMLNPAEACGLVLHSNEICDEVGTVRVLAVRKALGVERG